MKILIDPAGLRDVYFHRSQRVNGELRHYYLGEPPALAIIVSRCGELRDLANAVCDVSLGKEKGMPGFCARGYENQWHSKLTVRRIVNAEAETTLSAFLQRSRKC